MVCNHTSDEQSQDFLMVNMITDRIGWHKVLLPVNQNNDKNLKKKLDIGYMFSLFSKNNSYNGATMY